MAVWPVVWHDVKVHGEGAMMAMGKRIRVYADASVYGGAFDDEFDTASGDFFASVRAGRFQLVVSTVVRDEL
jgi:hypothetical protein